MLRGTAITGFGSKIAVQGMAAVLVSVVGASLLGALHWRAPEDVASQSATDGSATDERSLTREYLRHLREPRESPAEVTVHAAPPALRSAPEAANAAPAPESRAVERAPAARLATVAPATERAEASSETGPAPGAPLVLSPIVVRGPTPSAAIDVPSEQELREKSSQESLGGKVFSAVSTFLGTAANVTGDSVNFIIDLPGKAIDSGGKLIRRDPPPPGQQTQP